MSETAGTDSVWTIVVGGGSGSRFGAKKQYELLGGERIIDRSRRVAEAASDGVVVVVPPEDAARERAVAGGATRTESVRAGLAAVPESATIVLVHDAVRPLASPALYESVVAAVAAGADAVIPAVPVIDTIKQVAGSVVVASPDRSQLVAAQTPQGFRADVLRRAYESHESATDDAALVEAVGGSVSVVAGEAINVKVTDAVDLTIADALLGMFSPSPAAKGER